MGKRDAAKAHANALKRADHAEILAGAARFRDDPNRTDEYTPHPTTWLNRDSWGDDPLPSPRPPAHANGSGTASAKALGWMNVGEPLPIGDTP